MIAVGETPQTDPPVDKFPANTDTAPKKQTIAPKINLSAGLVAKKKIAANPANRPAGVQTPSPSSSTDSFSDAKRKDIAPNVNLSAGLVPKEKSDEPAADGSTGVQVQPTTAPVSSTAARR